MGKRSSFEPSPLTATAYGNAGDEHDGVSDSRDTEPSIITATGGNAGDEHDVVSDSSDTEPSIITATAYGNAGDEHDGVSDSSDTDPSMIAVTVGDASVGPSAFAAFAEDIRKFEIDSKDVPQGLLERVVSKDKLTLWFEEIARVWAVTPPETPEQASALVNDTVVKISGRSLNIIDIQAFSWHYKLPFFFKERGEPAAWIYPLPGKADPDEEESTY